MAVGGRPGSAPAGCEWFMIRQYLHRVSLAQEPELLFSNRGYASGFSWASLLFPPSVSNISTYPASPVLVEPGPWLPLRSRVIAPCKQVPK
jgi:hypothetical protein